MARSTHYRQCRLSRPTATGVEIHIAFLPEDVAKIGNTVRFRDSARDPWSEGWEVLSASALCPAEAVESASREWKHHRDVTDV